MRFTQEQFYEFFNALYEGLNFIIQPIVNFFEQILSYPILAYAFFVPTGLGLVWLSYEFILWASDFRLSKENPYQLTSRYLKRIKNEEYREEQNLKSQERFMLNYEQRDNYYNAVLMNKAAQLEENTRYHDEMLKSKISKNDNLSFDIEKAKERSRDRTRDIGNMKRNTKRSVNND